MREESDDGLGGDIVFERRAALPIAPVRVLYNETYEVGGEERDGEAEIRDELSSRKVLYWQPVCRLIWLAGELFTGIDNGSEYVYQEFRMRLRFGLVIVHWAVNDGSDKLRLGGSVAGFFCQFTEGRIGWKFIRFNLSAGEVKMTCMK